MLSGDKAAADIPRKKGCSCSNIIHINLKNKNGRSDGKGRKEIEGWRKGGWWREVKIGRKMRRGREKE